MSVIGQELPSSLSIRDKDHFIDGKWRKSASQARIESRNPATGEVIATLSRGDAADIDEAVRAARRAFKGPWSSYTPAQRHALLLKVADMFEKNFDELSLLETLDMGNPIGRIRGRKANLVEMIHFYAGQTSNCCGLTIPNSLPGNFRTMTLKAPVGVVGGIIPWNGPMVSQLWIIAPVLATGCTLVLKPAEDASLVALRTAELISEAGVPPGVINVVTGLGAEAGSALANHPDVDRIAFTGSVATAREIIKGSASNMKRLSLELGGKSPDIIFADANLDKAIPGAAMAVYANSGQRCIAGTRILVERKIQQEFTDRLIEFSKSLKIGNPLDMKTDLGPIVSQRQLDRILDYVQIGREEGAELAYGGERLGGELESGFFVGPTVFSNVSNSMRIAREEIFGPVISIIPFDDADEALELANDTDYGLAGAVWTSSIRNMNKMVYGMEAGTVWVNCYGPIDPAVGFGGYKQSGYGWKGGYASVDSYLYQKAVTILDD